MNQDSIIAICTLFTTVSVITYFIYIGTYSVSNVTAFNKLQQWKNILFIPSSKNT